MGIDFTGCWYFSATVSLVQILVSITAYGLSLPWDSAFLSVCSSFGSLSCSGFITSLCDFLSKKVVFSVQPVQGTSTSLDFLLCFQKRLAPHSLPHKGKALAQHKQGWGNYWLSHPHLPSHLCALASSVTTESFPFHFTCAMVMPSCLADCLLAYRRQNRR